MQRNEDAILYNDSKALCNKTETNTILCVLRSKLELYSETETMCNETETRICITKIFSNEEEPRHCVS